MSSDNGVYVANFPNGEIRVLLGGSDSLITELTEEYWFDTPEEYRDCLFSLFSGTKVWEAKEEALNMAHEWSQNNYTEYGVQQVSFRFNIGQLPTELHVAVLPEGACEFCSGDPRHGMSVHHGTTDNSSTNCSNPELPYNKIVAALSQQFNGIQVRPIAAAVVQALYKEK